MKVGWESRSGLMGEVENVRFGDRHHPIVNAFSGGGGRLLIFPRCWVRCL